MIELNKNNYNYNNAKKYIWVNNEKLAILDNYKVVEDDTEYFLSIIIIKKVFLYVFKYF
jgi:hypothetical protein